jgi:hypothetical protein
MSFRANSFFEVEIPCFAAGIPCSFGEQGIHANPLILLSDQARWPPKTGKLGPVFENSLLAAGESRAFRAQPPPH